MAQLESMTSGPRLDVAGIGRIGLYAAGALVTLTLAVLALDYLLRADTFPVKSVSMEGEFTHASRDLLAEAVAEAASGNFFALDLDALRRAAEAVPWVHRAAVRRRWPDGVHIAIREQQLAARWKDSAWVNIEGELADLHGQEGPAGLPSLDGPDGTQGEVLAQYRRLSEVLAPLGRQIVRLRLTPRHTWQIALNEPPAGPNPAGGRMPGAAHPLHLVLGREPPLEKVARFARHYPTFAAQAGRIRQVDLRYTNGFAVEWLKPSAVDLSAP